MSNKEKEPLLNMSPRDIEAIKELIKAKSKKEIPHFYNKNAVKHEESLLEKYNMVKRKNH